MSPSVTVQLPPSPSLNVAPAAPKTIELPTSVQGLTRLQDAVDISGVAGTGKGWVRGADGTMVWTDLATQGELDVVSALIAALRGAIPVVAAVDAPPNWRSIANYGANGAADQGQVATMISDLGGKGIGVLSPGTYQVNDVFSLVNDVVVLLAPGGQYRWAGSAGGTMVTSPTADPLMRAGFVGLAGSQILPQALVQSGVIFDLHSPQFCKVGNFEIRMNLAPTGPSALVLLRIRSDATNASGYRLKKHCVASEYFSFKGTNWIGRVLDLRGTSIGGVIHSVTENTFRDFDFDFVQQVGYDFRSYVDSNFFAGRNRVTLQYDGAIGLLVNSDDPLNEQQIYGNVMQHFGADSFPGLPNRIAIQLNNSKQTVIYAFANNPPAEIQSAYGSIIDGGAFSFDVTEISPAGSVGIRRWKKGVEEYGRAPTIQTLTDAATVTIDPKYDELHVSALAQPLFFASPAATIVSDGREIFVRLTSATQQPLSWDPAFRAGLSAGMPILTTGSGKTDHIRIRRNNDQGVYEIVEHRWGY